MLQDVRYAFRVMRKAPGFTLIAVMTLALGIGANTAIFSVVNALLIKPLPYAEPDRLVMVWQDLRPRGGPATEWTGPSNHFDWKAQTDVFEGLTTFRGWNASLSGDGLPEALLGEQTTYDYFDVLGVRPALGRLFQPSDDVPNAPRVVVLSHGLWAERFGADRAIIGRAVTINGESHEVIGVLPESFRPVLVTTARLWRPLRWNPVNPARGVAIAHTVGRLKSGVSLTQARSALAALAGRLEQQHPETETRKGINPVPLQEQQVGGTRIALLVLLGAVAVVLLIACVNIASLLLARASVRLREIALRMALGAGRGRMIRQLLTESLVLAVGGGVVGVLIGIQGVTALTAIAPDDIPRLSEIKIDITVLTFAACLTLATGILFGLVPAWHASRRQVANALKEGGRGQAGSGGRDARRVLIVAELALALTLLVGSGLLLRTFLALQATDLGFNPDRVLAGFVLPPPVVYKTGAQRRAFYDRVLERAAALPGVQEAALSSVIPLSGDSDTDFEIEGRPRAERSADALVIWYRDVSANYFRAMGIPLRRGRLFEAREPAPAVVINEMSARTYWPGEDPIGRRIRFERDGPWFTIVGIVGDVRVRGARMPASVEAYVPYWFMPEAGVNIVLKTASNPAPLGEPLKKVVKEVDPGIAVAGIADMRRMVAESIGESRFYATLVALFASLALVLAAVGVYGVMSYAVAQRTAEIGVRLALGAAEGQIFRLIVGDSLRLALIGLGIGAAGALVATRSLQKLLFGVRGADPFTFAATSVLLVTVAFLASYIPARRAMRTQPMEALRAE